jgi:hypothetical protein
MKMPQSFRWSQGKESYIGNEVIESLGGVIDKNGNYIDSSGIATKTGKIMYGKYPCRDICSEDTTVVYIGAMRAQWGHFLIDSINRLWYIFDAKFENSKVKLAYCHSSDFFIKGNIKEVFELLNLHINDFYSIDKPTKFRKVIIPEAALVSKDYYTDEYVNLIERLKKASVERSSIIKLNKIFFTRTNFLQAIPKERGTEEIERFFKSNGFNIIAPEKLPVKDQIFLMMNCKVFASIGGTAPHMLLFASPDCKAIICNKVDHPVPYQYMVNAFAGISDITFIDAFFNPYFVTGGGGPFVMYCSDCLKRYAFDNHLKFKPTKKAILSGNIHWYFKRYRHINRRNHINTSKEDYIRYNFFSSMIDNAKMTLLDNIYYNFFYFRRNLIQLIMDFRRLKFVNTFVLILRKKIMSKK